MRVIRHVAHVDPATRPRVVAAGEFDGLHRGHQRVLQRVRERATALGGEALVVLGRGRCDEPRLDDRRQQLERLHDAGVDTVVFAPATALSTAVARVGAAVHVRARGSGAHAPRGGQLEEIEPVTVDGTAITSAAIAVALARGDLPAAAAMLGRDAGVGGRVVHGFHRGRPLGIPTANLRVRDVQLPPDGVYVVRATIGADRGLRGVANIGFNPTFGNRTRTVETHLLDIDADLYGRRLQLAFLARLRGEQKFDGVPALLAQIRDDIAAARRYFEHDR
jgi:riboflavin kinase/FMN adenylyltransferase